MTTTAVRSTGEITVVLWLDHDERVNALPRMALGVHDIHPAPAVADRLCDLGARRVDLPELVDLSEAAESAPAVRTLGLIRELTARGISVGWRLRLSERSDWRALSHLWPPHQVVGAPEDVATQWRRTHYLGKCLYRHGPGFVQVRDRRGGELVKFTIDEPDYLAAITVALDGTPACDVPADVLANYAAENLLTQVGNLALWLPYRARRWPTPSMAV
jgi:hypothetical protein